MWTGVLLPLVLCQAPPPPPTVAKLVAVTEHRFRAFEKNPFAGLENLTLHAELQGPLVKSAVKVGNLRIASATDDQKTDLMLRPQPVDSPFNASDQPDFRLIQEFERPPGSDRLAFSVQLKTTPRTSRSMSTKGTIDLMAGSPASADFARIKSLEGTTLENADLEALKLKVSVLKPGRDFIGKPAETVELRVVGDVRPILEYSLLDATGKKLNAFTPFIYPNADRTHNVTFNIGKVVPPDAALRITFLKHMKLTPVAFEFKNVELP